MQLWSHIFPHFFSHEHVRKNCVAGAGRIPGTTIFYFVRYWYYEGEYFLLEQYTPQKMICSMNLDYVRKFNPTVGVGGRRDSVRTRSRRFLKFDFDFELKNEQKGERMYTLLLQRTQQV